MDPAILFQLIILTILIILSAFFSGSETALTSVNHIHVKQKLDEGELRARVLTRLLSNPHRFLSAILIGNNLVNVAASALATSLAIDFFGNAGVGIATGVMTLLILTFGEITPKSYCAQNSLSISLGVARIINGLSIICEPVIRALTPITNTLLRLLGEKGIKGKGPFGSVQEIMTLVRMGRQKGNLKEEEKRMIQGVFDLSETTVKEVMIPRADMTSVPYDISLKQFIGIAINAGYSRIPVHKDRIDNIVGILYVKDLLRFISYGPDGGLNDLNIHMDKIMRKPNFVPETKPIGEMLKEFRERRFHIAIVVDEYGIATGIVTVEDILEEIVGDIEDEYDQHKRLLKLLDDGAYLINPRIEIDHMNEELSLNLPKENSYETLGGFLLEKSGKIPSQGEVISFENLSFEISKATPKRIEEVILRIKEVINNNTDEESDEESGNVSH